MFAGGDLDSPTNSHHAVVACTAASKPLVHNITRVMQINTECMHAAAHEHIKHVQLPAPAHGRRVSRAPVPLRPRQRGPDSHNARVLRPCMHARMAYGLIVLRAHTAGV